MATSTQTIALLTEADVHPSPGWDVRAAGEDKIPKLHSGDHLTGEEFERRYQAMPGVRAELIEGVVYVASPVSADHGEPHLVAMFWLGAFLTATPGVTGGVDTTIRLDLDNRPQPDGHLRIRAEFGGRARISEDRYLVGAPELVIEIARSTVSYDLHDKLNDYRRNEVLDYVVLRVDDGEIDWFTLQEGRYERLELTAEGVYKSPTLLGFWLDPAALLQRDYAAVYAVVQRGLASAEHAEFVARLAKTAARLATPAEGPRP